MKLPPFDWLPVKTVAECVDALSANDSVESRIIAGGQSLLPLMALGMASPALLIDVNGVEGLSEVIERENHIDIGALVRHRQLLAHADRIADLRIVGTAARHIGHVGIRNRGTLGGSLSHADPASELPAIMLLLKASMVCESKSGGVRTIPSDDFFLGPYTTSMHEHEMLTRIIVPRPVKTKFGFSELAARHGDFATAGAAVAISYLEENRVGGLRAVIFATSSRPMVVSVDVELPIGEKANSVDWKVLAKSLSSAVPAGRKRELTRVMLGRAFLQADSMNAHVVH
jgi:Aerobic-type carbon monoxide dehydrogenase, middle subunit CoxM/CutM homologs